MTIIREITLRKILDSRGNPTVEADVITDHGWGRAAAPSGASTGRYEARVRPPGDAIEDAETKLIPHLLGEDARKQVIFDSILREVDGTRDFSEIGANVAVSLSIANAKAAASALGLELFAYLGGAMVDNAPLPLGNVIGGGAHAQGATEIQEFLVVATGARNAGEAVFTNALVHAQVRSILTSRGIVCGKGDEGAWAPSISDDEAFEVLHAAAAEVSDKTGVKVDLGLDVAASQFFRENDSLYHYRKVERTAEEQIGYIAGLVDQYGLIYVEDPLHEEDFSGFADLTEQVGDRCLVCGDDLYVTNPARISQGIELGASNAVLIKPNQIGTLSDTVEAIRLAHSHGMDTVMSHRSGETVDTTIAHLGTAFSCIFLKSGIVGGERIAKLNELIRIEEYLE